MDQPLEVGSLGNVGNQLGISWGVEESVGESVEESVGEWLVNDETWGGWTVDGLLIDEQWRLTLIVACHRISG